MGLFRSAGQATVFVQATQPAGANNGDLWVNNSTFLVQVNNNGTFQNIVSAQGNVIINGVTDTLENFLIQEK